MDRHVALRQAQGPELVERAALLAMTGMGSLISSRNGSVFVSALAMIVTSVLFPPSTNDAALVRAFAMQRKRVGDAALLGFGRRRLGFLAAEHRDRTISEDQCGSAFQKKCRRSANGLHGFAVARIGLYD